MKEHQLLSSHLRKLKAKRFSGTKSKPQATGPHQFWGIDMTKIMLKNWGWVYLHVVLELNNLTPNQFEKIFKNEPVTNPQILD